MTGRGRFPRRFFVGGCSGPTAYGWARTTPPWWWTCGCGGGGCGCVWGGGGAARKEGLGGDGSWWYTVGDDGDGVDDALDNGGDIIGPCVATACGGYAVGWCEK